jgi:hypothetical protein
MAFRAREYSPAKQWYYIEEYIKGKFDECWLMCKRWSFPTTSHEDSEEGWNAGLPSLLWYLAQLGLQSCQLYLRNLPANKYPCSQFCLRLSGPQGYWMWTEGIGDLIISKHCTRNQTWNLPLCGVVPQPTAPPQRII